MLHGVGVPPPHIGAEERPYWITRSAFRGIVELLRSIPARLTFDDGNASDAEVVLPALADAGLKASFFIPSDRIGSRHYLSEQDIRTLYAAGMEIGSHGCAHLRWTELTDGEIAQDVTRSIARLSAVIDAPVRSVAIPFGCCDRRVLRILRLLGAARVYSSFRGPEVENGWLVRRDCVMAGMSAADVRALVTAQPSVGAAALTFLRIWRRVGNAAIRTI